MRLASPGEARRVAARLIPEGQRRFVRRWGRDPGLGYPEPVSALWLEFDRDDASGAWRAPLLCARLDGRVDPEWLVAVLFPALAGRPLAARQAEILRRAVSILPPPAHVLYAFSLRPRHESAVRVEVFGLEPAEIAGYLEVAVSPAAAAAADRLAPLVAGADRYHLAFDMAEEALPRIGVECGWRRLAEREPRWRRFLDLLVAAGLATSRKRDAVLGWPGYDSLWSAPRAWPEEAVGRGGYLVRSLSHVKLVAGPGCEPLAKAYLLFQHVAGSRTGERAEGSSKPISSASASAWRT